MKKGLICIMYQLALASLVGVVAGVIFILSRAADSTELIQAWLAHLDQFVGFMLFTTIGSLPLGLVSGFFGQRVTRPSGSCAIAGYIGSALGGLTGGIISTGYYMMLIIVMSLD